MLGYSAEREQVDALFDSFDTDGSGNIEFGELNKQLRPGRSIELAPALRDGAKGEIHAHAKNAIALRTTARAAVGMDDDDEDGSARHQRTANVPEIRDMLARERSRVIDMFRACDEDGDARITRREFRAALPLLGVARLLAFGLGRNPLRERIDGDLVKRRCAVLGRCAARCST